jgi:hypothetical protein
MANRFFPSYPSYIVTSPFGMRYHPVDKVNKMHNGIDLVATADGETGQADKIMAHTGGVVDGVGFDKDAGNFVRIRVDLDTVMYYFHLRDMSALVAGEAVQTGQIIGIMGQTGKVTNKHLHFGIKYKGRWIDPAPYLEKDWVHPQGTCSVELPILRSGDNGDAVRAMQILLAENGYKGRMNENAFGSFGSKTENALKSYQKAVGLSVSGECDKETWTKLIGG